MKNRSEFKHGFTKSEAVARRKKRCSFRKIHKKTPATESLFNKETLAQVFIIIIFLFKECLNVFIFSISLITPFSFLGLKRFLIVLIALSSISFLFP